MNWPIYAGGMELAIKDACANAGSRTRRWVVRIIFNRTLFSSFFFLRTVAVAIEWNLYLNNGFFGDEGETGGGPRIKEPNASNGWEKIM